MRVVLFDIKKKLVCVHHHVTMKSITQLVVTQNCELVKRSLIFVPSFYSFTYNSTQYRSWISMYLFINLKFGFILENLIGKPLFTNVYRPSSCLRPFLLRRTIVETGCSQGNEACCWSVAILI